MGMKDTIASLKVSFHFHTGLRRLTWWWCCSLTFRTANTLQQWKWRKGYWRWGGQRGGCFLSNHKAGGDAGSQLSSILSSILFSLSRKEARKPTNISWPFPETASELWPTWFCSWANTGILPQTIPDKIHSKLYHTDKWRVKQNFLWSRIHFMEAVFLHLRNPEQSKIVFQSSMKVWSHTSDKYFAIV